MLKPVRYLRQFSAAVVFIASSLAVDAMTVLAPTFDELVAASKIVVRGVVTDVKAVNVDTPQGQAIRTLVTVKVERSLKGSPDQELTLSFLGGKVGRRTMKVLGMPAFAVGDRQILFVGDNGKVICPVIAAGHGRYHIRRDAASGREYVARDNQEPLASIADVAEPLEHGASRAEPMAAASAMSPEAFEEKIIAAVRGGGKAVLP